MLRRFGDLPHALERHDRTFAAALLLLFAGTFGALALLRHWSFHSTALDLAVFDQVIWNTVEGRFMESTLSLGRCTPHSFFGDHFSPMLLAIVPAYALVPRPETLLIIQTAALAAGIWPLYLLARRCLSAGRERLVWVIAYVLSAPLAFISLFDFHEITLAVAPLGFAFYFLVAGRTVPLLACLFAAFLVKEEVALIGVGFGVALLLQRRVRLGVLVTLVSLVTFVATLKLIIPAFAGGAPYQYLGRYASLGRDEAEIMRTLVLDPLRVLSVLGQGDLGSKVIFVASLFGPGLGLAMRSKWALAPVLPSLGYLLLSDFPGQHTHHNHYAAPLIPLVLGASVLGMSRLGARGRRLASVGVLSSTIGFALAFGGMPFTPGFASAFLQGNSDRATSDVSTLVREPRYDPFVRAVAAIPQEAAVSSRDFFTTQLGPRRSNYYLSGLDTCDAEYVILDYADRHVKRDLTEHLREVDALQRMGFREIASGEGLSLLHRPAYARWR